MFSRLFKKPKLEADAPPLAALDKLNKTHEWLEEQQKVLMKKASQEEKKAKNFTREKRKRLAMQCSKRRGLYEQEIELLENFQLQILGEIMLLERAVAVTKTKDALRTGAAALKAMQTARNIYEVDETMDEINEQKENMKQVQEALSIPIGAAADSDEVEPEAELEGLECAELEEQLLQPATTAPAAPVHVPAGPCPSRPVPQRAAEEDELAAS